MLRHPRTTVAVAALFAGAPPLLPGIAVAGERPRSAVRESGQELSFGSGRTGLRCRASADRETVTVSAEATLRVVNDTGRRARLALDGVPQGDLPGGAAADVLFHRGPVRLVLRPVCGLTAESTVRVMVVPATSRAPTTAPAARAGAAEDGGPPAAWARGPAAEVVGGAVEPVRDRGPIGLLALTASVCLVGVLAGAIRAIATQRASRAVVA
ncbi:hypothetical protein GCM10027605_00230 [Micromonospora zhanjiangensis]